MQDLRRHRAVLSLVPPTQLIDGRVVCPAPARAAARHRPRDLAQRPTVLGQRARARLLHAADAAHPREPGDRRPHPRRLGGDDSRPRLSLRSGAPAPRRPLPLGGAAGQQTVPLALAEDAIVCPRRRSRSRARRHPELALNNVDFIAGQPLEYTYYVRRDEWRGSRRRADGWLGAPGHRLRRGVRRLPGDRGVERAAGVGRRPHAATAQPSPPT